MILKSRMIENKFKLKIEIIGYQPDLHPSVTGYHRLPACLILAGYW